MLDLGLTWFLNSFICRLRVFFLTNKTAAQKYFCAAVQCLSQSLLNVRAEFLAESLRLVV